ncbi:galactose-specific lectin nattectin-like [Cheilinus undulatus]|uniref:galactose-specific lectin nattectin-like n=1 Tax=Cheilinus undulatus TaxID=241271 RepID=UPI001BD32D6C|nr:galactose-specific lectin nattectin-like [Cheilinus undulatus]
MASGLQLIALLCLTGSLLVENAYGKDSGPCKVCPPGWAQFEHLCYMFNHNKMDWADAERFCTTVGGNLASIHSKAEFDHIENMLLKMTGKHMNIWLGGYDAVKEGVWLWSDGSHFDFKFWSKGQPSNYRGMEHCMEMNFLERVNTNDNTCNGKKSFFCLMHL